MMDKSSGKVTNFPNPGGKGSDAINMMLPYKDSVLWMGTNNGLVRFSTRTRKFQNFGKEDGMPADEFNMYSRFMNDEGEIFMGTIEGMFSFHPDSIEQARLTPLVHLSKMRLNGKVLEDSVVALVNRDFRFTFDYGKDLYLEFSPMTFFGNGNYQLEYRVSNEGQDTTWKKGEAGLLLPLVRYDPGEYTLRARLVGSAGTQSPSVWIMRLTIVPPFWMTWPFRIFLISLGLLMLYVLIRFYIGRRLEHQRQEFERQQLLEKERSRISAELHDDIGGGLTAIRLMSEMVKEADSQPGLKALHVKISDAANDIVQKMNEIVWALNINHDDLPSLVAYTRQFAMAYLDDMGLRTTFRVPDRIPAMRVSGVNRRNIFLLVKESLNNIVKHAGATEVNVDISLDRNLRIRVSDNGRGLPRSPRQGNGLSNMRKRVDSMEGNMSILSDGGTTITFTIPLDRLGT
jgi:signal transduction histidine kinase